MNELHSSWFTASEKLAQHVWPSSWGQPYQNKPAPKQTYSRILHSTLFLLSCVTAMLGALMAASHTCILIFPCSPWREESYYVFHHSLSRQKPLSKKKILPPLSFKLFWLIQVSQKYKWDNLALCPLNNLGPLRSLSVLLFIVGSSNSIT